MSTRTPSQSKRSADGRTEEEAEHITPVRLLGLLILIVMIDDDVPLMLILLLPNVEEDDKVPLRL